MPTTRKKSIALTPAAEVALANIHECTYGTWGDNEAISRALIAYWQIMETQRRGEDLRTRPAGGTGRTKLFKLESDKMPERYVR
ncbi:hypothetical protein ACIQWN_29170 [Streptomyces vinaceus]|uniref:hypothetical protein n=1 Tax=Streptomyces vinaceus TaxID=1960 RepID=UPI00381F83C1